MDAKTGNVAWGIVLVTLMYNNVAGYCPPRSNGTGDWINFFISIDSACIVVIIIFLYIYKGHFPCG